MNTENEYKEFIDYWDKTIKVDSLTALERKACFMCWMEAKKRALNLYNVNQKRDILLYYEKFRHSDINNLNDGYEDVIERFINNNLL